MAKLDQAIYKIIFTCLKITPQDSCLILVDQSARKLGQLFFQRVCRSRADVALLEIKALSSRLAEPSPAVVNIMRQMSAILAITSPSLIHTSTLRTICHNGARVLCLPPLSEEILARSTNTDYEFIERNSRRIADLFSIGHEVRLRTPAGTSLVIPIKQNNGSANIGIVSEPGNFCLIPAGEASIIPDSDESEGTVVVDGTIPVIGIRIKEPVVIKIKAGYAYQITGGHEVEKLRQILKPYGKKARYLAEFGLGTNPHARLTGISIEDEKVLGTAHIALGSPTFEGAGFQNNAHLDFIIQKPTVTIDGHLIIEKGNLLV